MTTTLDDYKDSVKRIFGHLHQVLVLLLEAAQERRLPNLSAAAPEVQHAAAVAVTCLSVAILLLASPRLRYFIFAVVETVLAVALLIILVGFVLGIPFGESRPTSAHPASLPVWVQVIMVERRSAYRCQ